MREPPFHAAGPPADPSHPPRARRARRRAASIGAATLKPAPGAPGPQPWPTPPCIAAAPGRAERRSPAHPASHTVDAQAGARSAVISSAEVTDLTETEVPTMPFDDRAELADDEPDIGVRGEDGSDSTIGEGEDDGPDLDDWGEGDYDDVWDYDADDDPRDRDGGSRAGGAGNAWARAESPAPKGKRPCNIAPEIRLGETTPATTVLRREWDKIRDLDSDLVEHWTMRIGKPGKQPRAEVCGAPSTDFRSMVLAKALKGQIAADNLGHILDLVEGAIQRLDHGQVRGIANVFDAEKNSFIAVMRWAELLEEAFRARPGFRADKDTSKKRQSRRRKFLSTTWPQITDLTDPVHLTPHNNEVQRMLDSILEDIRARVSLTHVRSRLADARLAERVQEELDAWIPFDDGRASPPRSRTGLCGERAGRSGARPGLGPDEEPTDPGEELHRALDDLADSPSWADVNRIFPVLRDRIRNNQGAANPLLALVARRARLADPVDGSSLCAQPPLTGPSPRRRANGPAPAPLNLTLLDRISSAFQNKLLPGVTRDNLDERLVAEGARCAAWGGVTSCQAQLALLLGDRVAVGLVGGLSLLHRGNGRRRRDMAGGGGELLQQVLDVAHSSSPALRFEASPQHADVDTSTSRVYTRTIDMLAEPQYLRLVWRKVHLYEFRGVGLMPDDQVDADAVNRILRAAMMDATRWVISTARAGIRDQARAGLRTRAKPGPGKPGPSGPSSVKKHAAYPLVQFLLRRDEPTRDDPDDPVVSAAWALHTIRRVRGQAPARGRGSRGGSRTAPAGGPGTGATGAEAAGTGAEAGLAVAALSRALERLRDGEHAKLAEGVTCDHLIDLIERM